MVANTMTVSSAAHHDDRDRSGNYSATGFASGEALLRPSQTMAQMQSHMSVQNNASQQLLSTTGAASHSVTSLPAFQSQLVVTISITHKEVERSSDDAFQSLPADIVDILRKEREFQLLAEIVQLKTGKKVTYGPGGGSF